MIYLIDGYNLLFRLLLKGEELRKAREALIAMMSQKVALAGLKARLIFDSQYQEGWATEKREGPLLVIYTNEGETADEWILSYLKKGDITVVTSDKQLARHVRIKGAHTLTCEAFLSYLENRARKRRIDPMKKSPPALPQPQKKVAKGSTEYYEALFEKDEPKKKKIEPPESDYDRWLRVWTEGE